MRVYLSKKCLTGIAIVAALVIAILLLLRIVFIWDQSQGVVEVVDIKPTVPQQEVSDNITDAPEDVLDEEETKDDSDDGPVEKPPKKSQENVDESRVDSIISKIYDLRYEYVNKITMLEAEARAEKNGATADEKLELIERITSEAVALEEECDAKMNAYLKELTSELRRLGRDTSMISEIRTVYQQEKEQKRSQLLNKYDKYLK